MTRRPPPVAGSAIAARVQALGPRLSRAESVLAQWLLRHEATLGLETGASIAAKTGVSAITVSRFLRRLGYRGLAGLKRDLLAHGINGRLGGGELYVRLLDGELGSHLQRDAAAVLALGAQIARPEWARAIAAIDHAEEVFVTGFQTVKGVAEDFARRLAIVRSRVRFLGAHDSGLAEWIAAGGSGSEPPCLILVDTVPYAREAPTVVRLARQAGMVVVVVTDELNTWAALETPLVFYVITKVGTFVESTGPLASLLNLITHAVAEREPERARDRLARWPGILRALGLF